MSSAADEKYATKLIDTKRNSVQLMMRKPLYFCLLMRIEGVTPSWKSGSAEKRNMQESNGLCWRYSMFLEYLK